MSHSTSTTSTSSTTFANHHFSIADSTASHTYGKSANSSELEIKAGSEKKRLQFTSQQQKQNLVVAQVYVETIEDTFFAPLKSLILWMAKDFFIEYKHNGERIYININSLSKRLGIPKEEIKRISESKENSDNELANVIQNQFNELVNVEIKVEKKFQEILIRGIENKPYVRQLLGIAAIRDKCLKPGQEAGIILNNRSILHLKKIKEEELSDLTVFTQNRLGQGSYGWVEKVEELSHLRSSVAKVIYFPGIEGTTENEYKIVKKIHKEDPKVGIQQGMHSEFKFRTSERFYAGYIAEEYDGDLLQVMSSLTPEEKIECARQLLKGLAELERQEIVHGDIKANNCLFRRGNGKIECVIADLGGAVDLSESISLPKIGANRFKNKEDTIAFNTQLSTSPEKAKEIALKRDVYAMGFVMDQLLPEKKADFLIAAMKARHWEKRVTAAVALERFEKIYKPT